MRFQSRLLSLLFRPTGARKVAVAGESDILEIDFVLRTPKEKQLEQVALDAPDPDPPNYGHYLPMDKILAEYGPNHGVAQKVVQYLAQQGLEAGVDVTGLYVKARMNELQAEKLSDVTLSRYVTADVFLRMLLHPTQPRLGS